jgi:HTH-type transcriptional regulator, transcriptional repressor of NAD biosynthesis genes
MKTQTIGLVLGKFAPLHKGHQYLIETAIKKTNKVIVLIYNCPNISNVPLNVRADWIRKLYPQVKVIEAWDAPPESGRKKWIMKKQEEYIKKVVPEKVTHFFSSEWYGKHVSRALGAKNIMVDKARTKYPTSGTKVRKDPYKYKKFVDPIVYKNLVKKVVFVGAESTGKSTITIEVAKAFNTVYMEEYGREYWDKNQKNGKLTLEQLAELAEGHIAREEKLLDKANNYLIVDTNAITTEMFSRYYHGCAHKKLLDLARRAETRYDYYFLCDIDIPYEDESGRSGTVHRIVFQKQIIDDLKKRKIKYLVLSGDLKTRIKKVKEALKKAAL